MINTPPPADIVRPKYNQLLTPTNGRPVLKAQYKAGNNLMVNRVSFGASVQHGTLTLNVPIGSYALN